MSQVVQQEAPTRLPMEKGIFTKEEFLETVRVVDWKRIEEGTMLEKVYLALKLDKEEVK
jgi:hypothetical protein